jgi:hypothetical protein
VEKNGSETHPDLVKQLLMDSALGHIARALSFRWSIVRKTFGKGDGYDPAPHFAS